MIADHAQPDRVGARLVPSQQLPGLAVVAVGSHPLDVEIMAEETGLELVVLRGRSERDADDFLHETLQI